MIIHHIAWGRQTTSASSTTLLTAVKAIATTVDGKVRVQATGFNDTNIDDKYVYLEPKDADGTAMAAASDMSKQVSAWECGAPAGDSIVKFLPGSCKANIGAGGTFAP